MKHNIITIILVTLGLIVVGLVVYIALKPDRAIAPVTTEQKIVTQKAQSSAVAKKTIEEPVQVDVKKESSELVSIDAEWNKYTNHMLGFSMNVPKNNYLQYSFLEDDQSPMDKCLNDKDVHVISDDTTGRVYIGSSNIYADDVCYQFSFDVLDKKLSGQDSRMMGGLVISIYDIDNNAEALNTALEGRDGYDGCMSNGKEFPDGKLNIGEHLVLSDRDEYFTDDQGCFLNWAIFAFYSTEKEKLALCDLGQAYRFLGKNDDESVQNRMFDSFMFE